MTKKLLLSLSSLSLLLSLIASPILPARAQSSQQIVKGIFDLLKLAKRKNHQESEDLQKQDEVPNHDQPPAQTFSVGGMRLDQYVSLDSHYNCEPSRQFASLERCAASTSEREQRGAYEQTTTILKNPEGRAFYLSRYLDPAFYAPNEIDNDLRDLSAKFGQPPNILTLPERPGLPRATIAFWGGVGLENADQPTRDKIAAGKIAADNLLVDFLNDPARSARETLPIYRMTGTGGYVWIANYTASGIGTLRFLAINPTELIPQKDIADADGETRAGDAPPVHDAPASPFSSSAPSAAPDAPTATNPSPVPAASARPEVNKNSPFYGALWSVDTDTLHIVSLTANSDIVEALAYNVDKGKTFEISLPADTCLNASIELSVGNPHSLPAEKVNTYRDSVGPYDLLAKELCQYASGHKQNSSPNQVNIPSVAAPAVTPPPQPPAPVPPPTVATVAAPIETATPPSSNPVDHNAGAEHSAPVDQTAANDDDRFYWQLACGLLAACLLALCLILTALILKRPTSGRAAPQGPSLLPTAAIEGPTPEMPPALPVSEPSTGSVDSPPTPFPDQLTSGTANPRDASLLPATAIPNPQRVEEPARPSPATTPPPGSIHGQPKRMPVTPLAWLLFSYQGRIGRAQFWLGSGVCTFFGAVAALAVHILDPQYFTSSHPATPGASLILLLGAALQVYLQSAVGAKRCHDRNRSGWFLLFAFIPVIGALWLVVELGGFEGDQGSNRFGPSPFDVHAPQPGALSNTTSATPLLGFGATAATAAIFLFIFQNGKLSLPFLDSGPAMKTEVISRPVDDRSTIRQLVVTSEDPTPFTIEDIIFNANPACRATGPNSATADAVTGYATLQNKPTGNDITKGLNAFATGIVGLMSAAFNDKFPKEMSMGSRFSFGLGVPNMEMLPGPCNGQSLVQTDIVTDRGTFTFTW